MKNFKDVYNKDLWAEWCKSAGGAALLRKEFENNSRSYREFTKELTKAVRKVARCEVRRSRRDFDERVRREVNSTLVQFAMMDLLKVDEAQEAFVKWVEEREHRNKLTSTSVPDSGEVS
ncbi:MAG: hypothetical protein ABSB57_00545 [Dehalococcoidia bacterium]